MKRDRMQGAPSGRLMTDVKGVAAYLSTTETHVRKLVYERRIPFAKVGRLVRFDLVEIDQWITSNSSPASGQR